MSVTWEVLEERLGPEVPGWLGRLFGEAPAQGGWPLNSEQLGYQVISRVKSGAGSCYGFSGYNSGAAGYVLLFDTAEKPAASTVPCFIMAVAATSNFWVAWTPHGRSFARGLWIATSSTATSYTATPAVANFDVQYD